VPKLKRLLAGIIASCAYDGAVAQIYDFSAVTQHLEASLDLFDGNVLVIIKRADEVIYQLQLGETAPITPDTVVHMASATKWISAGTILSVAESGGYALDDRVGDYVPVMESQGKGDITIRQCFSMTTGLYGPFQNFETDPRLTLQQSVNLIAIYTPVAFDPGSQMGYHGKGMQVAGLIAQTENPDKLDWRVLAQQRILGPCQMHDTTYDEFGINPAVAGGIRTTALDYLKYLKMVDQGGVYDGAQVLSQTSIDEMVTNQTYSLPIFATPFPSGSPWYPYGADDLWYAFGCWVLARNPVTGAAEELTSPGAWGTFPWIDKRRGIVGILVSDVPPGTGQAIDPALHAFALVREAVDRVILGDVNDDASVDADDWTLFAPYFAGPTMDPGCAPYVIGRTDFQVDGDIDLADFAAFQCRVGQER